MSISYLIPSNIINVFAEEALNNVGPNGRHLETLALLVGRRENGTIIADEIIFPKQTGFESFVNDDGK